MSAEATNMVAEFCTELLRNAIDQNETKTSTRSFVTTTRNLLTGKLL